MTPLSAVEAVEDGEHNPSLQPTPETSHGDAKEPRRKVTAFSHSVSHHQDEYDYCVGKEFGRRVFWVFRACYVVALHMLLAWIILHCPSSLGVLFLAWSTSLRTLLSVPVFLVVLERDHKTAMPTNR